jgi:hypothetical protein
MGVVALLTATAQHQDVDEVKQKAGAMRQKCACSRRVSKLQERSVEIKTFCVHQVHPRTHASTSADADGDGRWLTAELISHFILMSSAPMLLLQCKDVQLPPITL